MKIRVLGCSGGIGSGLRTTSILIDDDILVDCGSGAGDLTLEEMYRIRHIFITHCHLDHIAFIPLLIDSAFDAFIDHPVTIHLQDSARNTLCQHIFNGKIWPDYLKIPDEDNAVLRYDVMDPGQKITINNRIIEAIPVTHTEAAVGYRLQSSTGGSFAYTGDTKNTDQFWQVLNAYPGLDVLVIECAYPDHEQELGHIAGHHRPSTLAEDLCKLEHQPQLYIMHQKPGDEEIIMHELAELVDDRTPKALQRGQVFEL